MLEAELGPDVRPDWIELVRVVPVLVPGGLAMLDELISVPYGVVRAVEFNGIE